MDRENAASQTAPDKTEHPEFSGSVLVAEDGNKAMQKVTAGQFDPIFMDIQMPHMDGHEAARAIRKEAIATPIVALTANTMKGDDKKCIKNSYSQKRYYTER